MKWVTRERPRIDRIACPWLVARFIEDAYQIDYGAATVKYIDAFLANIQWDAVNQRLEQARADHRAWAR